MGVGLYRYSWDMSFMVEPQSLDDRSAHDRWPIVGNLVALGPIAKDHLPAFTRWFNDPVIVRGLGILFHGMTAEEEQAWYERTAAGDPTAVHFTIYERASGRPIGNTALVEIDRNHGTAIFGIAIGDRRPHGRGYGTEVTRLMVDYAFQELGLVSVLLHVNEWNLAGRRAYEKAGFREIGRRRQAIRTGRRRWDDILMACDRADLTTDRAEQSTGRSVNDP